MAFKLNNKSLPIDTAFTANGISYPANWLRLSTSDEKKAIGITEVADSTTYDQRFYWSPNKAKALAGLKTNWITQQKRAASNLLSQYDWYIIRKLEEGTDIPGEVSNYRDNVRTTCDAREKQINAVIDVTALQKLVDSKLNPWPEPLGDVS
jgi:hypothetical protein